MVSHYDEFVASIVADTNIDPASIAFIGETESICGKSSKSRIGLGDSTFNADLISICGDLFVSNVCPGGYV